MVHPRSHSALSIREDILTTLRRIEPDAQALGSMAALEHLQTIIGSGSDADMLRREFETSGSAEGMVDAAIRRFRS
jgi:carboxylate-amine ligase